MKDGVCPECGSEAIYTDLEINRKLGVMPNKNRTWINIVGKSKNAHVTLYVCAVCGYFRSFLADKEQLARIEENWTRIRP